MEHNKRQHAVQQAVQQAAPVPERSVSPIQVSTSSTDNHIDSLIYVVMLQKGQSCIMLYAWYK